MRFCDTSHRSSSRYPPGETYVHEIDGRLKKDLIDEIITQDAGTFVGSIDEIAADPDNVEHITGVVKVVNDAQGETEKSVQPKNSATENSEEAKNKAPVKTPPSITALSFADQRQLVHIHTLKQMVANDESLTNGI